MVERLRRARLTCAQFISHVQSVRTTAVSFPIDECTSVPNSPMNINGDWKNTCQIKLQLFLLLHVLLPNSTKFETWLVDLEWNENSVKSVRPLLPELKMSVRTTNSVFYFFWAVFGLARARCVNETCWRNDINGKHLFLVLNQDEKFKSQKQMGIISSG